VYPLPESSDRRTARSVDVVFPILALVAHFCFAFLQERSEEEQAKVRSKLFKKDQARQQKIKDLGIDYEYEGFVSVHFRCRLGGELIL
jgi:hypothetical protein